MNFKEYLNEAKIKYIKGKTYQSTKDWNVYANDDSSGFSINVNQSAGWSLDPHDKTETTFLLQDNGKTRASLSFKEGNIQSFADKMYLLNAKTTWGETQSLTSKDYADIIRVWIDMIKHTRNS